MWFGTQNSGLNRYDGYNIKIYRHNSENSLSISNDDISDIIEMDGKLWIGTWSSGLDCFDPITETFKHYYHDSNNPKSLSNNRAQNLFIETELVKICDFEKKSQV